MLNKKIILIPAYEPTIEMIKLLKKLQKEEWIVIVVDDGSGKSYQSIFKKAQEYATVLTHPANLGKGKALKTGFEYIEQHYQDSFIVTMDCDGQHTVKDAKKLLDYLEKNPDTLVLGKRKRGKNTPFASKFGNILTRGVYYMLTGTDIYDTQTGLRAFHEKMLFYLLQVKGDRFEYEMNMLLACCKNQIPIKEVEIETIYINHNSLSHFRAVKDSLLIYKEIILSNYQEVLTLIVDYFLYSLLFIFSHKVIFSNVISRCVSVLLNYQISRRVVFLYTAKKQGFFTSFFKSFFILLINTVFLVLFIKGLKIPALLAKVVVEIIMLCLLGKYNKSDKKIL